MSDQKIDKIHDLTAKTLFAEKGFLEPFLRAHLPEQVSETVRWEDVLWVPLKGRHVNKRLMKERHADVVYEARYPDGAVVFWVHIEAQSSFDHMLPIRLLNYQTGVLIDHWQANQSTPTSPPSPPAFFSLVLYHGLKPYPEGGLAWQKCFADEEWAQLYSLQPILVDLSQQQEQAIVQHPKIAGAELAFKYILKQDFSRYSEQVVKALEHSDGAVADIVLEYLIKRANIDKDRLLDDIKQYLPDNTGGLAMQLALQYEQDCINKGIQKGRQEGIQKGRQEGVKIGFLEGCLKVAKGMLEQGFDLEKIAELTQLPLHQLKHLQRELETIDGSG